MKKKSKRSWTAFLWAGISIVLFVAGIDHFAQLQDGSERSSKGSAEPVDAERRVAASDSLGHPAETQDAGHSVNTDRMRHYGKGNSGSLVKTPQRKSDDEVGFSLSLSSATASRFTNARYVSAVNNAMDRELEADEIAEDFGARMEGLFRDRGVDEMVRNFAVQHLERFAQERTIRGTWDVDSDEAAAIRAALEDAALEVDSSIGGTAMLALARLSEIDPHVDMRRLSSRSSSLVANPSARLSTRIAAAQLCGLLRVRSALPSLRSLAADPATPTPLRLAAQHAAKAIREK